MCQMTHNIPDLFLFHQPQFPWKPERKRQACMGSPYFVIKLLDKAIIKNFEGLFDSSSSDKISE